MTEEFNLSEKIEVLAMHENTIYYIKKKDVKEFIKRIFNDYKFKIIKIKGIKYIKVDDYVRFVNFADKLCGEKLK